MPSGNSGTIKPASPKKAQAFFREAGYGRNTPAMPQYFCRFLEA
jgi:hypothetical protein